MSYRDFCNVNNVKFGMSSVAAFRQLEDLSEVGNAVAVVFSVGTFAEIFVDRRSFFTVAKNISTTEWEEFSGALLNINQMTRNGAQHIIHNAYNKTSGEERKFWRCMDNAIR